MGVLIISNMKRVVDFKSGTKNSQILTENRRYPQFLETPMFSLAAKVKGFSTNPQPLLLKTF